MKTVISFSYDDPDPIAFCVYVFAFSYAVS